MEIPAVPHKQPSANSVSLHTQCTPLLTVVFCRRVRRPLSERGHVLN